MLRHNLPQTLASLAMLLLIGGCSKETSIDASEDVAGVGNACGDAGDLPCNDGTLCVYGVCRLNCQHDDDCRDESVCVGEDPFGCTVLYEIGCSSSQPCQTPALRCDPNGAIGACRQPCVEVGDCKLSGYVCTDGVCVPG